MMGLTERYACCLPGPVDAGTVVDAEHDDGVLVLVDLVHHPVGTAACRVKSGKFALEAPVDTVGITDQCAEYELDDRGRRAFRQSPQLALGRCGDSELVGVVVGHFAAKRARSSSPVM